MLWKILSHPLFLAAAGLIFGCIITRIYHKRPQIKAWFKPDEFQKNLITDRDGLQKENEVLREKKELLLDELTILRKVDLINRAKLDEANAEIAHIRSAARKVTKLINDDITK